MEDEATYSLTVQWKDITTGKWDQVNRFQYQSKAAAAEAAKRFMAVSWVRMLSTSVHVSDLLDR